MGTVACVRAHTWVLLPVLEHTHGYHQFLFRLIFAFVIVLNIIFSALLWVLNVSPLYMDFFTYKYSKWTGRTCQHHQNHFKIISFAAVHDTTLCSFLFLSF